MGRLINGINGPIQGKVGTVIGSSWKGIPYLKGPHKKRTEKVSDEELRNRKKFAAAQLWLKPLLKFVRAGFRGYSPRSEGFVAAKSYLLKNAMEVTADSISINPAMMLVSFGDLPLSEGITAALLPDHHVQFTWDADPVAGSSARDQVMLLAYDAEHRRACYTTTGQFRSDGADVLKIPSVAGCNYHLYLAFTAADRSRQSNSVYMGAISS